MIFKGQKVVTSDPHILLMFLRGEVPKCGKIVESPLSEKCIIKGDMIKVKGP